MSTLLPLLNDALRAEFGAADLAAMHAIADAQRTGATATATHANALLRAAMTVRKKSEAEVYRWAGAQLAMHVVKSTPSVAKGISSTRTVLLQLNRLAVEAVSALMPDALCPDFFEDLLGSDTTRIGFDGPESVALMLEGAVMALGAHYGERIDVSRGTPNVVLVERRLVDVKVLPDRRSGSGSPPPPGAERRSGVLAGVTTFLR
jgi:hypothetical protein